MSNKEKRIVKMKKYLVLFLIILLVCGCGKRTNNEYNYNELATNGEVNIKISDIDFYEDYVDISLAFENISQDGIEYGPLDFVLQTSDGNNEKYIHSSRENTSLSAGGQINWELMFNYHSTEDMKLIYKKDFKDKTISINLNYDELTGIQSESCDTNAVPLDIAMCEAVNQKGIGVIAESNLTDDELNEVFNKIKSISGVTELSLYSKRDLYNILIRSYPQYNSYSLEQLNIEDVIIIKTNNSVDIQAIVNEIKKIDNVQSFSYWG